MADDAVDLRVDQLLGGGGALLRVAGVVFGQQLELDLLAADRHALGVQLVDGHLGAQFVVLAQVRNGAAGGTHVADLDHCASCGRQGRAPLAAMAGWRRPITVHDLDCIWWDLRLGNMWNDVEFSTPSDHTPKDGSVSIRLSKIRSVETSCRGHGAGGTFIAPLSPGQARMVFAGVRRRATRGRTRRADFSPSRSAASRGFAPCPMSVRGTSGWQRPQPRPGTSPGGDGFAWRRNDKNQSAQADMT